MINFKKIVFLLIFCSLYKDSYSFIEVYPPKDPCAQGKRLLVKTYACIGFRKIFNQEAVDTCIESMEKECIAQEVDFKSILEHAMQRVKCDLLYHSKWQP